MPEFAELRPMLLVSMAALVTALFAKAEYKRSAAFSNPIFILLNVFVLAQVISVYYSGIGSMFDSLGYWYIYPVFVTLSVLLISSEGKLRQYIWGMILGGMFIVGYGMYALHESIGLAATGRAGAYGMYENHNDYTFIIIQVFPFLCLYLRAAQGLVKKSFLAISVVACIAGVFLSLSRGGILALILEMGLIVWLMSSGKKRVLLLALVTVVSIGAVGYQWTTRDENQTNYSATDAEESRFELWRAAWSMFKAHPLLGVGSRRFGEFTQDYGEISGDNRGKNSHNTYFEVLATSGLLGFISFLLMVGGIIRQLTKRCLGKEFEGLEPIRIGTLVAICSILFRAFLDAKPHDWSFYVLCSICLAYVAIRNQRKLRVDNLHGQLSEATNVNGNL